MLRLYQKEAVAAFTGGSYKRLITYPTGCGKTRTAIECVNADSTINTILIVCPLMAVEVWRQQITEWDQRGFSFTRADHRGLEGEPNGYIISHYDMYSREGYPTFMDYISKPDLLILDESHAVKGESSRGIRLRGMLKAIPKALLLSATQFPNGRPSEGYRILKALGHPVASNWKRYHTDYCGLHKTRYGWEMDGATRLDELALYISDITSTCDKAEALKELPELTWQRIQMDQTPCVEKIVAEEDRLLEGISDTDNMTPAQTSGFAQTRIDIAMSKIKDVLAAVQEHIDNEEQVVVFGYHREPMEALKKKLGEDAVLLMGGMSDKNKDAALEGFKSGRAPVLIASSLMSVGFSVANARFAIFFDLPYRPGDVVQSIGRLHRHGQKNAVLARMFYFNGGVDRLLVERLIRKDIAMTKLQGQKTRGLVGITN